MGKSITDSRRETNNAESVNNDNKLKGTIGFELEAPADSVERLFDVKEVPTWKQQLTVRAFVVAFLLDVLFTFIVMKLNLTTGIIPSLNVSARMLGFFVKTWTKLLEKFDVLFIS
ncbi:probable metal-nicotianamine transporter YSL5 [Impatiens glandulifera]|uniref:probable metal-nicotianamine transporter YSL5 n=1 Tax=Impatiens glandulifera TaxID=253017 RepID=UPI001FB14372|nr:probable metal-nicotianamine transporter YSL5 [Impatiens glandulifera]